MCSSEINRNIGGKKLIIGLSDLKQNPKLGLISESMTGPSVETVLKDQVKKSN